MNTKTIEGKVALRSGSAIKATCDFMCNAKTRMITVDFITQDGRERTINGMLLPTRPHLTSQGRFLIKENRIMRNNLGQCKTVSTQLRHINLATVSRLAFNKVVYNFI